MFKSDQPLNYPFNAKSAALANLSFTALYAAPVIFGVGAPNILGRDRNSSYPFTVKQMGPYKVTSGAE